MTAEELTFRVLAISQVLQAEFFQQPSAQIIIFTLLIRHRKEK